MPVFLTPAAALTNTQNEDSEKNQENQSENPGEEQDMKVRTVTNHKLPNSYKTFLIPEGSRRQLVLHIIWQAAAHPRVILHYMNPYKLKRAFYYLTHGGIRKFHAVLEERMLMGADLCLDLQIHRLPSAAIKNYPRLHFKKVENPLVSIIIPVCNQFRYTYTCLAALKANTDFDSYEIIIADDCSKDDTTRITKIISGIRVIRTEKQSYFLKNCNHAASYAQGDYLLFLNNDTQVQKGWLSPLVDLMIREPKAGIVGSCLIYPDGRLQEAGGIIWKDGSAWNYGNGRNPAMPEYRYVKEVDYVSGASILVRRTVWESLGGFDEQFAPAYCEDSDLAFSARRLGYQVLYQPSSLVVHFEGISNGRDTSQGIKVFQEKNQKRLYAKWKQVLEKEQLPHGQQIFLARDRGQNRKKILIMDHRVPCYDKDAGGRTVFMYAKLFLELGLQVTFFPDDFYPHQPYTRELEQLGIEVLYGNDYVSHWRSWLEKNAACFDYVYLNRPQVSIKYIEILRKFSKAKLIYYGHDLHYLREEREYALTGNQELRKSSKRWKKIERQLFLQSDVIYAVGEYEYHVLKKAFPDKTIRCVPAYIYPALSPVNRPEEQLEQRRDILFVGGFGHPPNLDAVLWFAQEIFPLVLKEEPQMVWHIVGVAPPEPVRVLAGEHIRVHGYISDEELDALYRQVRLVVAPLRYGAGVKGKIVECIYQQCPLLTTAAGVEGLPDDGYEFAIARADRTMAEQLVALYRDTRRLAQMIEESSGYINRHFTRDQVLCVVGMDIKGSNVFGSGLQFSD